ncbi:Carboxylic ester hydrolase [Caenorhabditis elegans]|uniref:Carboxylic ester hydrolase n=1 Tax=Caenorhabditis elegans TaxID=6239 RepID=Q8MQ23_CAEEL|nr:Carboxylic ester hydrolase [Caenorhabditis elegans]CAD44141.1 Carboxylic ester hydrolase [Caenorhabditis elegans]|eukprot:NP_741921.1 Carboxylic ester hydrolase [Caenorhabditis elegans]
MKLLSVSCLLLLHFASVLADPTYDVTVQTPNGSATIRGIQHTYGTSFRGIRYAQPPVGLFRFGAARRLDPVGLVEAQAYGNICVQGDGRTSHEDCLFINVYTPNNVTQASKLPVYVYIHGGGFVEGGGNMGAGIYPNLVNKGPIVMVSINYRLGPFGFFSTRQMTAPGNWAISDWIEALNWVQRYISFFGGDPNRVTIGGQSSGAEAVSTLTLTPLAKNLFKQSIHESGSAFGAAVMSYSEKTRSTSKQLSIKLGCATSDQWDNGQSFGTILTCLRNVTYDKIVAADNSLPGHRMKWSIVQDNKYLTQRLEYLALQRDPKKNVLIGDVHDEWLGWEMNNVLHNINSSHNTAHQMRDDLSGSYEMTYWDNKQSVLVAADNKYINNQGWTDDNHREWEARRIQLWSEMVFIGPTLRDAAYFQYMKNNVYLYSLDWLSPPALPLVTDPLFRGCEHTWELQYIFSTSCNGFTCTAQDEILRNYFTTTWLNFIIGGNPTPAGSPLPFKWLAMDSTNRFLSFSPNPKMQPHYHPDSMFWVCTAPTIDGYKGPFC